MRVESLFWRLRFERQRATSFRGDRFNVSSTKMWQDRLPCLWRAGGHGMNRRNRCLSGNVSWAALGLLIAGMTLQETGYSAAADGHGQAAGSSLASKDHQTDNLPICQVHGAAACTAPSGAVHLEKDLPRSLRGRQLIVSDVSSCANWNYGIQRKSSECDGSPVRLVTIVPFDAERSPSQTSILGHIIDSRASRDIDETIKFAAFWNEVEGDRILRGLSTPFFHNKINREPSARVMQLPGWHKFPYDVTSAQERATIIQEKGSSDNSQLAVKLKTYNGSDRLFHTVNRGDEWILALSDGERNIPDGADQTVQSQSPTSYSLSTDQVRPFSDGCKSTIQNGVWNLECPKDTAELHSVVLPPLPNR
jgi:hypothetical protein